MHATTAPVATKSFDVCTLCQCVRTGPGCSPNSWCRSTPCSCYVRVWLWARLRFCYATAGIARALFAYERGFSFFSLYSARRDTPATLTTLNRTPGMSPTAWPRRPKPAIRTSSCRAHGQHARCDAMRRCTQTQPGVGSQHRVRMCRQRTDPTHHTHARTRHTHVRANNSRSPRRSSGNRHAARTLRYASRS